HPAVRHIYEDSDATVGNHFVFIIHRDIDIDRDRVENDDRQRNEIKTYDKSEEAVKGLENETFIYRWKFRINADLEVSTRVSHFFQLKAVGGPDSQPILTISGAERSGEDGIEVRHSPLQDHTVLERVDWSMVTGEWLEAYCRVTFSDSGDLRLIVTRMRDDEVIFNIDASGLDLWRGEDVSHFVRPKWGIYRSILDWDNLRPDEENVRFANFSVSEVMPAN
ncbi:MAG: dystroglycan-type cadherin-like protein, partial [Gammaproteobacteria bacterium]|nr:dystroglycan-type cadherin-like protein [Gammaproteobacteria bacterium]